MLLNHSRASFFFWQNSKSLNLSVYKIEYHLRSRLFCAQTNVFYLSASTLLGQAMYQLFVQAIKQSTVAVLFLAVFSPQLAAQCNPDIPLTKPNHRYDAVPATNGEEVLDKATGLIWQRCPMGMNWDGKVCAGKPNVYTWLGALQVARSAKFNINTPYFGRWRLPYNQELLTLVDRTCFEPAINRLWFPGTPPTWFWSSTPGAGLAQDAYYVDFYDGEGFNGFKDEKAYVRLTRNAER